MRALPAGQSYDPQIGLTVPSSTFEKPAHNIDVTNVQMVCSNHTVPERRADRGTTTNCTPTPGRPRAARSPRLSPGRQQGGLGCDEGRCGRVASRRSSPAREGDCCEQLASCQAAADHARPQTKMHLSGVSSVKTGVGCPATAPAQGHASGLLLWRRGRRAKGAILEIRRSAAKYRIFHHLDS